MTEPVTEAVNTEPTDSWQQLALDWRHLYQSTFNALKDALARHNAVAEKMRKWRDAAEAYERGDMTAGDVLIWEARRG